MVKKRKKNEKIDLSQDIENVEELMNAVLEDSSVPRNIRKRVNEAKQKVLSNIEDLHELNVNISFAIYALDDISNDINMPSHTRTEIWTIISELEALKEKIK